LTSLVAWGLHSLTRNVMLKPMVCLIVTALGVATQIAESVAANAEWDRSVLPRPSQPFQGTAERTFKGSEAAFIQPVNAPQDAPNVLLALIDDAGFGNPSTVGGPVATPTHSGDSHQASGDPDKDTCELYNLDEDFSQAENLADKYPDKVRELTELFWAEAEKYQVLPLFAELAFLWGSPKDSTGQPKFIYYNGTENISSGMIPRFTIVRTASAQTWIIRAEQVSGCGPE